MSRYIDADALDKRIYNDIPISVFGSIKKMAAVREIISQQPTVEAEPIMRCKDCKNYKLFTEVYTGKAYCEEYGGFITENDYCSRGAKMNGKENE